MPQTANQISQTNGDAPPIDPRQNPIAWAYQNREALSRMPEDKAVKFVDMLFKRFALPKYNKGNRPPDDEELENLRLQFHARMYGLPSGPIQMKEEGVKYGTGYKAIATAEGAGAGVLGGIKTAAELYKKIQDHLGPIGKPAGWVAGKVADAAGEAEGRAYEDASLVSPKGASRGAAIGHQIPSTIATAGVGRAMSGVKAVSTLGKVGLGAAKGVIEGETYARTTPGADSKSAATWGGILGAAFPLLGKMFNLGRREASTVAKGVGGEAVQAQTTPKAASSLGDVAEQSAKTKFGKSYKDLTPTERAQMPQVMKEEIARQSVQKAAKVKAERAAAKAASEAEKTAQRAEKARLATEKAAAQAQRRASTSQAVASQAAQENPSVAKVMATFKEGEGTSAAAPGQTIRTNDSQMIETAKHELEKAKSILKEDSTANEEEKRIAKDNLKFWTDKHNELTSPKTTKVPEGQAGVKVRAKGGKPASPAQQAADRERIAARRAEAKGTEFGAALEKHAQQLAGKYTAGMQVGIQHIPELEDTVREMEGGLIISGLQKLRKAGKLTDELYAQHLKDWLLTQFEKAN